MSWPWTGIDWFVGFENEVVIEEIVPYVSLDESALTELVEAGHAARVRYDSFSRPEIVTIVIGEENWRDELAAAGRAGGVIRSALPTLGSRE